MIRSALLVLLLATGLHGVPAHAGGELEAPRVQAALAQARAAELGIGIGRNLRLALALYCDAGTMGSREGFFQLGRVLATAPRSLRNRPLANTYLALAARLGKEQALEYYDPEVDNAPLAEPYAAFGDASRSPPFDLDAYLSGLSPAKQRLAGLIRGAARQHQVDARLALAIALAESDLDPAAVSANDARGVMQLAPATQQRFGVTRPFDREQNVSAAMAYLRVLQERFAGDWRLIAAAYGAGEGSAVHCSAVSPCLETRQYVRRVLHFAGFPARENPSGGLAGTAGSLPASPAPSREVVAGRMLNIACCD